jgi:hypothetical protein
MCITIQQNVNIKTKHCYEELHVDILYSLLVLMVIRTTDIKTEILYGAGTEIRSTC